MADLLSPREAALRLGISYPTMKQWLYRGKLKAIKTPGGHYRIPEAELDSLLHKARRAETSRAAPTWPTAATRSFLIKSRTAWPSAWQFCG